MQKKTLEELTPRELANKLDSLKKQETKWRFFYSKKLDDKLNEIKETKEKIKKLMIEKLENE